MTSRRDFVFFVGCALLPQAHAQPRRREVRVAGRRIRTIDVHAHCVIPEAEALMKHKPARAYAVTWEERLKRMDEQGIDLQALSINPTWYALERDLAAKVVQLQNEKLAELCARHPERLVAFASVALQYPDLAARELEHAVKQLGLRGAAIGGSVEGAELSDPKFHPFWAKAEELGVLVFMHPQRTPDLQNRLRGNGGLDNTVGYPLETSLALSHLIFEGTLDRFPGLKICAAHGGGFLPSYANRSDAVCRTFPNRVGPLPKKNPTAYLRDGQLFFDTIVFTPEALRHLIAETGPGQIVIGTDYPFPWTSTEVDLVLNTPGLSDEQRIAILGGTAARLLGIAS